MEYRTLGQTELSVSTVAMGCWAIAGGGTWGDQDEGDALDAIRTALEVGINFFDTAAGYGESEMLLGKGLVGRRDEAIIATKVSGGQLSPEKLVASCEKSLSSLQTDRIDLLQIHWPSRDVPLADTLEAMQALQAQGKIRHIGVSNFGPLDLEALAATGAMCASNQVIYSLLSRAIEFEVQPKCVERSISILPYSPLAQGLLTGKFTSADQVAQEAPGRARSRHFSGERPEARHGEAGWEIETFAALNRIRTICADLNAPLSEVALAWCLAQPGVTSVLAGARSPAQVQENAQAGARQLSPETVARLSEATDTLKRNLGPSIDIWQPADKARAR